MKEIKRIFFIQTAFFGDVIMSTPIPRALKQLPKCQTGYNSDSGDPSYLSG